MLCCLLQRWAGPWVSSRPLDARGASFSCPRPGYGLGHVVTLGATGQTQNVYVQIKWHKIVYQRIDLMYTFVTDRLQSSLFIFTYTESLH